MYDERDKKLNFANYKGPTALFTWKKIIVFQLIISMVFSVFLEYGFEENPDIWHSRNLLFGITFFFFMVSIAAIQAIIVKKNSLDNEKDK